MDEVRESEWGVLESRDGEPATGIASQQRIDHVQPSAGGLFQVTKERSHVWFEIDTLPYLLDEVLIRSGWVAEIDYGDRLYGDELPMPRRFVERWQIAQYEPCGGLDGEGVAGTSRNLDKFDQAGLGAGECDPSYPDVCIPPIELTGDLDCGHIDFRRFRVVPPDPHGFDSEGDGVGC